MAPAGKAFMTSSRRTGYDVTVVQNPTVSLEDDVAVTKRAIAAAPGEVILVGHSYGGVVMSEAGTDPKVAAVVYIAAFAPDTGESVSSLIANPPPGAPVPPILPPVDGFLSLDKAKFAALVRRRRSPRLGVIHGRFAGSVGRGSPGWQGHRSGLEGASRPGTSSQPTTR